MLIVSRLLLLYYFVSLSFCNEEPVQDIREKNVQTPQERPYRSDYSVGTYSRGALYSQSAITSHHGHETVPEGCNMDDVVCLSMASQDRLGLEAIKSLHRQLDDDADGIVDLSESDEFLREDLKYEDGYQRRQQAFHRNDDKHISVRELWESWLRSEVHNWTVEQTVEWLAVSVELPQYIPTFTEHRVTGATLPRLAVSNSQYLSVVLGIKDPIHKQKIALKAMDVVLFGPPKDYNHATKDLILVTLLLGALFGCWYAYRQNKSSRRHLRRMMKDMESLHKAELALEDLQRELEHAKREQENVATEKLNLERRLLEQAGDGDGMRISYSDLEVTQLKAEVEMLRSELQRAEGELQDRCWSPPLGLQHWLQLTHEIENKAYLKKRIVAEKQLQLAREACDKLRRKRSNFIGAFVSTHGKSIDDVDRSIVEARTALSEVTAELQERVHRWKQIELLCGFNIINNNGLQYLETVLYRNTANGRGLRGRTSSSQDDLDDETGSMYSPSAGCLEGWKEDSSGSEQGKNELEDEFQQESRSNVHFTLGADASWNEDIAPMPMIPVVPKRTHKSSMVRSHSQDTNVNILLMDKDRDREMPGCQMTKFSQSETNLDSNHLHHQQQHQQQQHRTLHSPNKKLSRDQTLDLAEQELQQVRSGLGKKISVDQEDVRFRRHGGDDESMSAFKKAVRDWEPPEDTHRKVREAPDDYRKVSDRLVTSAKEPTPRPDPVPTSTVSGAGVREPPDDHRRPTGPAAAALVPLDEQRKAIITMDEFKKTSEEFRRTTGLDDYRRSVQDDRDETYSTDSNSTAADELDVKRKKRKLFGNFRKNKTKLS